VAVFKVGGEMFALVTLSAPDGFVKFTCDAHLASSSEIGSTRSVAAGRHWTTVGRADRALDHDPSVSDVTS